jgi:hypothetical protein
MKLWNNVYVNQWQIAEYLKKIKVEGEEPIKLLEQVIEENSKIIEALEELKKHKKLKEKLCQLRGS